MRCKNNFGNFVVRSNRNNGMFWSPAFLLCFRFWTSSWPYSWVHSVLTILPPLMMIMKWIISRLLWEGCRKESILLKEPQNARPSTVIAAAAAAAKSLQSCPTLCDPRDGSPPGSSVPGILQARIRSGLPFPSPVHKSEKWK